MASVDPRDSTSVDVPVPDYEAGLDSGVKGLRVGIPKEYRIEGASPEIDALWDEGVEWLKRQGAEIVEVSLPHTKYALPTYYIVRRRRPPRTSPATTASGSGTALRAPATSPICMRRAAPKASARRSSAAS